MDSEDNFFACNIKILKISGLWLPLTERTTKMTRFVRPFYNLVCVLYALVFFTIAQIVSLGETSANIFDLVKNLNMSLSFILTLIKVTIWFHYRREIVGMMNTLQGTFGKFTIGMEMIGKDKGLSRKLSMIFFVLSGMVSASAYLISLVDLRDCDTGEVKDMKLPYFSYVPFDYKKSKLSYSFAVLYQSLALLICGTMAVGCDMLFFSLTGCVSTHFFLLKKAFKNLSFTSSLTKHPRDDFKKLIEHLQIILGICEKLESIYSLLILLQMLVSLIVFCTCLFIILMSPINKNIFGNEFAYMLAIENQLALYCFAGNKLTNRAADIPFALYCSNWLEAGGAIRKEILFTMMRMTKPIHITVGKFVPLTLATFVTIGRGSYSLLAVLRKRNASD